MATEIDMVLVFPRIFGSQRLWRICKEISHVYLWTADMILAHRVAQDGLVYRGFADEKATLWHC